MYTNLELQFLEEEKKKRVTKITSNGLFYINNDNILMFFSIKNGKFVHHNVGLKNQSGRSVTYSHTVHNMAATGKT